MELRGLLAGTCLLLAAGCAAKSRWTGDIEPPGLKAALREPFRIRVIAATPALQRYAPDLERQIRDELRLLNCSLAGPEGPGLEIEAKITDVAPGGAWGEEAECRLEVTWRPEGPGAAGGFRAIGYSGGTWGQDRIPTAVTQAALAVAARLAEARN